MGNVCFGQYEVKRETTELDCLGSYPGHSLRRVLPLGREAVGVFYSPSQQGKILEEENIKKTEVKNIKKTEVKKKSKKRNT